MKVNRESGFIKASGPDGRRLYINGELLELYGTGPDGATFCDRNGSITEARWRQVAAALMCYNVLIRRQVNRSTNNRQT